MAYQKYIPSSLVIQLLLLALVLAIANGQNLKVGFYQKTCPKVEAIVARATADHISVAPSLAAPLLRMHFHDCFVRGCDGSVLLDSTKNNQAEKDGPPNLSLRGYQVIDAAKTALEKECPGVVSCADILALVARDAIYQIKGPYWPVPLGRRDGRVSIASESLTLPSPFDDITRLKARFASKGLSVKDLVVLSGGTLLALLMLYHRNSVVQFHGKGDTDPSLDSDYVPYLKSKCKPTDATTLLEMDPGSFRSFDENYYKIVLKRRGLFVSDATLLADEETSAYVKLQAESNGPTFFKDFEESMVRMGQIGVLNRQGWESETLGTALALGTHSEVALVFDIANGGGLKLGFYKKTCPPAEAIVKRATANYIYRAPSLAASLLRVHFHDCFVRGCDGSVLLNSTKSNQAEKDGPPNLSLRGFQVIDAAKTAVEAACPGVVSCADILALVARDAIHQIKGPFWQVPLGRRDGRVSIASESLTLPAPFASITQLKAQFASKGLSVKDLVVLSGDTDPSLDPKYIPQLKSICFPADQTTLLAMDSGSVGSFDEHYYTTVLKKRGLFQSDAALLNDKKTSAYVKFQAQTRGSTFFKDFQESMMKMGKIGVLTGKDGAYVQSGLRWVVALSIAYDFVNKDKKFLKLGFYKKTCPKVEAIVEKTTANYINRAPTLAAALLRMHFHDCFVRGCDGSVLLNSTKNNPAEKDGPPNLSLRGYQVIDAAKTAVEAACPGVVSCADILALVARDAIHQIKGPFWPVPLGRRDGRVSKASESRTLPAPTANITQLKATFASKGLNVKDLVVLSGKGDTDPSLDSKYVPQLKSKCKPNDKTTFVEMDPGSSKIFDDDYYSIVMKRRGLFASDAALLNDKKTSDYVKLQVQSHGSTFFKDFKESMVKMGQIGVLTGNAGEVRKHCALIN
ncbi:hypothetical protein OSB04_014337 [Centaurea solstitialis]|uniref:peroxidase n=1 Tax=Centaurea solstitialis TaxID=347529 RepID=A0AA38W7Y9_9ASTR|nr:hypothetical protein OSB04_014337 [Centaurea solstitialis]